MKNRKLNWQAGSNFAMHRLILWKKDMLRRSECALRSDEGGELP
jgi:hypothetical protein